MYTSELAKKALALMNELNKKHEQSFVSLGQDTIDLALFIALTDVLRRERELKVSERPAL